MNIRAVAWSEKLESLGSFSYTMQATLKGKRELNALTKEVNGWKPAGEGFDPNTKNMIILLKKTFESRDSWVKFAKTLSFPVEEVSPRTGKKRIINGKKSKK